MQILTGIDLVEIQRIEKSLRHARFLTRVYSLQEQTFFASKHHSIRIQSVAANFAAKEAFAKALGTGVRGFSLQEVSLLRDALGAPYFVLCGRALEIANHRNLNFSVSVTHTDHYAAAMVVAVCP